MNYLRMPANHRLKLTAHLAKILSARSLAWALDAKEAS